MRRFSYVVLVSITLCLSAQFLTLAHPGSEDEHGCHYDEQSRKHCHVRIN